MSFFAGTEGPRKALKVGVRIGLLIAAAAALSSCDLSGLFGSPQLIEGFTLSSSENPDLTASENAIIVGKQVYLSLPYAYAVAQVPATPTVTLAKGATVSPSGTYALSDGMKLTVREGNTNYSYTLHLGVSAPAASQPPPLSAFSITQASNPSLSKSYDAVIYGTGVYITLPYATLTEELPVTPTASLAAGYTISPSGSYALTDGMTLDVTDTATARLYQYTLHVAADPSTSPPLPPLQNYEFTTANNSALSANAVAAINGNGVYITLPYQALENQTPLTPTVSLASGYSINPNGSYVPSDGMTLEIINNATAQVTPYTLHLAVSTSSIP